MIKPAVVLLLAALITSGATLVLVIPDTPADACAHAGNVVVPDPHYQWQCDVNGEQILCSMELDISAEDFERSMHRNVFRMGTVFRSDPGSLVEPGDPFVKKIAATIDGLTAGCTDNVRATVALDFVQQCIRYAYDSDLYGITDFWSSPLETLYCHAGDCEDTSVLLCSILLAMGLDAVILDFPGHVAVGVLLEHPVGTTYALGDKVYSYCETACDTSLPIGVKPITTGKGPAVCETGHSFSESLGSLVAGYRYLIRSTFGV